jgi:hypothetical protein
MSLQSNIRSDAHENNARVNFLRTAGLVLIALLDPGGLDVLVPTIYRLLKDLRHKRQGRAGGRLPPANNDAST